MEDSDIGKYIFVLHPTFWACNSWKSSESPHWCVFVFWRNVWRLEASVLLHDVGWSHQSERQFQRAGVFQPAPQPPWKLEGLEVKLTDKCQWCNQSCLCIEVFINTQKDGLESFPRDECVGIPGQCLGDNMEIHTSFSILCSAHLLICTLYNKPANMFPWVLLSLSSKLVKFQGETCGNLDLWMAVQRKKHLELVIGIRIGQYHGTKFPICRIQHYLQAVAIRTELDVRTLAGVHWKMHSELVAFLMFGETSHTSGIRSVLCREEKVGEAEFASPNLLL